MLVDRSTTPYSPAVRRPAQITISTLAVLTPRTDVSARREKSGMRTVVVSPRRIARVCTMTRYLLRGKLGMSTVELGGFFSNIRHIPVIIPSYIGHNSVMIPS